MAEQPENIWERLEFQDVSPVPLELKSYPPLIGWTRDASHPNPDIRIRMIGTDSSPEDQDRNLGAWDRSGSASARLDPTSGEEYHTNPFIFSVRSIRLPWRGRGSKAASSKGMMCLKCGKKLKPRQAQLVEDPMSSSGYGYIHKSFALGGCREHLERTEFGARRNDR